jgi:tRNA(Arg) A34 adenosine deaminase TadA
MEPREEFLLLSFEVALQGVESGDGGPFGAVVVRGDDVLASAHNQVVATNDPTAHAEIGAIRAACATLGSFQIDDCDLYSSCEPCPMCLGAIYWSRAERLIFAATRADAAGAGFDDDLIYREIALPIAGRKLASSQLLRDESLAVFRAWAVSPTRRDY